ncbi:membrane protein insertase YidC [Candidatus Nitrospira allomarina]|uniref:Membrane protein insertase YidC n=1 Tax=Candidatus Nitrospira allomarina TaxID=3020900 RepID=A0AA96GBH9_9BACT|nr:membrane protein insertase YidC [Candidatus Nitrospira allomarina]WNM59004.1 membrane protein insertase YidC [Candidatus Nitrospira allomarina]
MEKRVVLFLILSLGIIFGYDLLLKELGYSPFSTSPIIDQELTNSLPEKGADAKTTSSSSLSEPSSISSSIPSAESPLTEEIVVVETPLFRADISGQGGVITSWELKKYLTQTEENVPVQLVYPNGQFPEPLTVQIKGNEGETRRLRQGNFQIQKDFNELDESHPTGRVLLTHSSSESDLWLQKELTFHYDSYVVDIIIRTRGISGDIDVLLGTNFGVVEWGQGFIGLLGSAWMVGDELEKLSPDADAPILRRDGPVRWLALQDKYFMSVFIPENANGLYSKLETEMVVSAGMSLPGGSGEQTHKTKLYAGPKKYDVLKSFEIGLEDTIDFGWFIYGSWSIVKAVAKPLFSVLRFIYDYTHNYGVAIILLTLGIKLLFVPLQYKSYKSMQGMQTIQPKVLALQEKFKDNKEKLNQELMKLYKEHKVNPVGGCLPMVLQMPVFVALFNILYMTIDLRQAPFMLWVTDLSAQDPYYVLPVLMGISMVVQQKIMPTTMDPTQAKMMMILPVGLTFLFVTFPAGLVLYWVTNNVLTVTQQFVTDRYILKKPRGGSTDQSPKGSEPALESGKKKRSSSPSGSSSKS